MNSSQPSVSIIVPIYNAGKYLEKCLYGLISQTLANIEIICVVDCPTDGSELVVKRFLEKDSRIKAVFNTTNLNISESRNVGLRMAHGEYIGFSDHDDWCEPYMYEELFNLAKAKNAECVFSNSYIERPGIQEYHRYDDPRQGGIIKSLILPMWASTNSNFLAKSVWASIYKREIISENQIYFPDRRIYCEEDSLFNLKFFLITDKIEFLNKGFYHWNKYEVTNSEETFARVDRQVNFFHEIQRLLIDHGSLKKYKKTLSILMSTYVYSFLSDYEKLPQKNLLKLSYLLSLIKVNKIDKSFRNHPEYKKSISLLLAFKIRLFFIKLRG